MCQNMINPQQYIPCSICHLSNRDEFCGMLAPPTPLPESWNVGDPLALVSFSFFASRGNYCAQTQSNIDLSSIVYML
jgi:hypothetical protein